MNNNRPDWVPENAGDEFAIKIVKGVESFKNNASKLKFKKRKKLNIDDYVSGLLNKDRTILARTITLIESNSPKHITLAQEVIRKILPYTGNSVRIGITGVPGAGKSTFIESFGNYLINKNKKVAVLAIDPSSTITKGSVLGDKTRMETLSRSENCFIRPSPSGGMLGGVTRKTRETILICEAAGYDVILVETVGVGQNEITVRSMVDFFLLMKIAGAGDELQGIKKGVIELADAIFINKSDGDNKLRADIAREEFTRALHYLKSPTDGWMPKVITGSAINNEGTKEIWAIISEFLQITDNNGILEKRRQNQNIDWVHDLVKEYLYHNFYLNQKIRKIIPMIEESVLSGKIPPTKAAQELIELFERSYKI
jgi:LAO/AO transport system kinase